MSDTVEYDIQIVQDDNTPPWDRECGHGPVSEWRRGRGKSAGERKLCEDGRYAKYYDMQEAQKIALREGWRAQGDICRTDLSPRQLAARAVEEDFQCLRRWCEGQWYYVGVVVTRSDTGESASLWGIESDAESYIDEIVAELTEELGGDE